jgi:hypothetical protein
MIADVVQPTGAVPADRSNPVTVIAAGKVHVQNCSTAPALATGQLYVKYCSPRTYAVVATFVLLSPALCVVATLPLGSVNGCPNVYPPDVFVVPSGSVTVPVNIGEAAGAAPVTCDTE